MDAELITVTHSTRVVFCEERYIIKVIYYNCSNRCSYVTILKNVADAYIHNFSHNITDSKNLDAMYDYNCSYKPQVKNHEWYHIF